MTQKEAQKIIKQTRDGYNAIADHFTLTRNKFWADGELFARFVQPGDRVLDAGCGTGRFAPFVLQKGAHYVGCDNAEAIIDIARNQYANANAEFVVAELNELPFVDNDFDTVFCLAALHHIPSEELQKSVMKELYRVTKQTVIVTVWNLHANYYKEKFSLSEEDLARADITIPWYASDGKRLMNRYVHAFTKKECETLASETGFAIKTSQYINHRETSTAQAGHNLMLILTKQ